MKNRIEKRLRRAIKERVFPGCVLGVVFKDGERILVPKGNFTYKKNSQEMNKDSIFDVASITKSIPTACLALKLIEQGRLNLNDKIVRYVPGINNKYKRKVLIRHLLTHTIFYLQPRLSLHKDKSPDELINIIMNLKYRCEPGIRYAYANASSVVLGLVVEKVADKPLDVFAKEILFNPLKMGRTTFHPKKFSKSEIVPTEFDIWRGRLIQGEVHDESAWSIGRERVVGSAGLFSTVPDLLNFFEALLNEGVYKGTRLFKPETVRIMYTNQLKKIKKSHGLGWELFQRRYMGKHSGPYTFGKTGFTGCLVACDIKKGFALALLSNYIFPKRKPNADKINEVRRDVMDIVFSNHKVK